ncbi:MAG TPA: hypothetical protein VMC08_10700 [Bacteroidales bacterium]|nr:hypothetical protein [Bacteroidales bacterium]
MKRIFTLILFLSVLQASSQTADKWAAHFQFGADFMSRYIWRGLNLGGPGPSIQPNLGLKVGNSKHEFSLGAWGAYTFGPTSNEEVDLSTSYSFRGIFTVAVTDYFFPGSYEDKRNEYFYYRSDSTGHVYEASVSFNGTRKIPVTFLVATNFYGNDAPRLEKINDSTYNKKGIQYSTYLEIGFKACIKTIDFNAFIGGTVNNPDESNGETGYYHNTRPGITNIGIKVSKSIAITDKYAIGLQSSLIANPLQNKLYLVFGISF